MNCFKKGVATILLLTFLVTLGATQVYGDSVGNYDQAIDVMSRLFLIPDHNQETFQPEKLITRGEFADLIMVYYRGVENDLPVPEHDTFLDVGIDHKYFRSISGACSMGFMEPVSRGLFRPEGNISTDLAIKTIVTLLGYKTNAQYKGDYPLGYMTVAFELEILKGVQLALSKDLAWGQAVQIIYNATEVRVQQVQGVSNAAASYALGLPFIEETLGFRKERGVLNAYGLRSIDGRTAESTEVIIGDTVLDTGFTTIPDILGFNVTYYYKHDEISGKDVLLYVEPYKNTIVEVKKENLVEISGSNFTFVSENQAFQRTISISPSSTIIFNGKILADDYVEVMDQVKSGMFRFIDANTDGFFETLSIISTNDYVVRYIDKVGEIIIPLNNLPSLDLSQSDIRNIRIQLPNGRTANSVRSVELKKWDIMTVAQSLDKSVVDITISTQSFQGKVGEISQEGDTMSLFAEGVWYKVSKDCDIEMLRAGFSGVFYLNSRGEIAAGQSLKDSMATGLIISAATKRGLDSSVEIKLLDENNQLVTFTLERDVILDGERIKNIGDKYEKYLESNMSAPADRICNFLWGDGLRVRRQLIRFKTNEEGQITEIDTPFYNEGKENPHDTLIEINNGFTSVPDANGVEIKEPILEVKVGSTIEQRTEIVKVNKDIAKLTSQTRKDVYYASDCNFIFAPRDPSDWDDRQYRIIGIAAIPNSRSYHVMAYKKSIYDVYASDVVIFTSRDSMEFHPDTAPSLITNVSKVLDGDQTVYKFTALERASNGTLVFADRLCVNDTVLERAKPMVSTLSGTDAQEEVYSVGVGDIVRYEINDWGRIESIEILYKNDQKKMVSVNPSGQTSSAYGTVGKTDQFRFYQVYVYDRNDDFITFSEVNPSQYDIDPETGDIIEDESNEMHNCAKTVVAVYDDKIKSGAKVRVGSLEDLVAFKADPTNMSRVFLYTRSESPRIIFITL